MKNTNRDSLKEIKWNAIMYSLFFIILGIVSLMHPEELLKTLGYLIGGVLIAIGALSMIIYLIRDVNKNYYRNDFVVGMGCIVIGVVVLKRVDLLIGLLPTILGVMIIISGCSKLQDAIDMIRLKATGWPAMLIFSIVSLVLGVILVIKAGEAAATMFMLLGVALLISGISDLISAVYFTIKAKDFIKNTTYTEIVTETESADSATVTAETVITEEDNSL